MWLLLLLLLLLTRGVSPSFSSSLTPDKSMSSSPPAPLPLLLLLFALALALAATALLDWRAAAPTANAPSMFFSAISTFLRRVGARRWREVRASERARRKRRCARRGNLIARDFGLCARHARVDKRLFVARASTAATTAATTADDDDNEHQIASCLGGLGQDWLLARRSGGRRCSRRLRLAVGGGCVGAASACRGARRREATKKAAQGASDALCARATVGLCLSCVIVAQTSLPSFFGHLDGATGRVCSSNAVAPVADETDVVVGAASSITACSVVACGSRCAPWSSPTRATLRRRRGHKTKTKQSKTKKIDSAREQCPLSIVLQMSDEKEDDDDDQKEGEEETKRCAHGIVHDVKRKVAHGLDYALETKRNERAMSRERGRGWVASSTRACSSAASAADDAIDAGRMTYVCRSTCVSWCCARADVDRRRVSPRGRATQTSAATHAGWPMALFSACVDARVVDNRVAFVAPVTCCHSVCSSASSAHTNSVRLPTAQRPRGAEQEKPKPRNQSCR